VSESPLFAGVELGGTKCVCLLAAGPTEIREELRLSTAAPQETLGAIHAVLSRWQRQPGFAALGLASFGPLELDPRSEKFGSVMGTPKSGWDDVPLLDRFRGFGVPACIDTDVNAAALAEGAWGAARGLTNFIYVTVGTGIGVGSVVDGRAVRGLGHSEAGHQRVPRLPGSDWRGNCPFHGDCVEGLASGPAIQARNGVPASELHADHPAWDEVVSALGALLHNLVLTLVPQRIVIGGGVVSGQSHLLPRLRRELLASLGGYAHGPRIGAGIEEFLVSPGLGGRAGSLGAIALAREALRGRP
jgi:fructokinase